MRLLAAIALALYLVLPLPAGAGDAEDFVRGGSAYDSGDYATALKLWRPLAEQGSVGAQFNIGLVYDQGNGVPQNYKEAVFWWRKAAEQGHAGAQANLGFMYRTGNGVPQDDVVAHMWSNLAAAQGSENGRENRDLYARRMTPSQIEKAQDLAREWLASHPN
jgi:uncharacterized protein